MGRDNGTTIVEGSDVCTDIAHWRKSKRSANSNVIPSILDVDGDVKVEPDYKVYLLELHALFVTEHENEVNDDVQEEDCDPSYKLFLENLKPHGNAYVLEIATNNGNKIIKYEDKGEDEYRSPNDTRGKSQYSQRRSLKKNQHHFGAKDVDSSDQKVKLGTRDETINEEYSMFLRHLSISEESFVFEDEDGNRIRYEESGDESSSDSDTKQSAKLHRIGSEKTPNTRKKTLGLCGKVPLLDQKRIATSSSGFRQGAMDVLQKPYDREEHIRLLKEAEENKPRSRLRQTRNQVYVYADENELCKSLLDHHIDLKKMIEAAKRNGSSREILYLLRGMFYYLERLPDDGKFRPWKDEKWMEEMERKLEDRV